MDLKNTFKSRIKENKIGSDIYLAQIDNYTNLTDTISKPVDKRFIQFYFCTRGGATFHFEETKYQHTMIEGNSLLIFNPHIDLPINISLTKKSKLLIIVITAQRLIDIFGKYKNDLPCPNNKCYKEKPLGIPEKLIIKQLEEYSFDSEFEELYLSSKLNELLIYYFSPTSKQQNELSLKDEKLIIKIQKVKEILLENISNPPTLKTISDKLEISEYKIKDGFKKFYGKTISNFVLDTKMEIGKDKLNMKVKQVKEIAYDLGYENPSHFIEAFKKKYGVTPKQWMMK